MPQAAVQTEKPKKKFPVKKLVKWVVIAAVLAAAALLGARYLLRGRSSARSGRGESEYTTAAVERRTITSALSGSGTLQPANSYTVMTLVEGDILSDTFEEGDLVEKDAVLYQIDASNTSNSIERSQISLDQAQRNYQKALDNRTLKSDSAGQVASLEVKAGDKINAGQTVARLRDNTVMTLKVPFPADDAMGFYAGQSAQVTLDGSFEVLSGTVKSVSGADVVGTGNSILREVTVEVSNPGGLSTAQAATAVVGGVGCAGSGVFTYRDESVITAAASGTVTAVHVKEGDWVSRDQTVLTLGGSAIDDQVKNASDSLRTAQLSMENSRDQLENYTITAPVSGTVVDKSKKAGETVSGNDKTLCTIYDLSYLEMTISIDELDINKVSVGQKVTITADAVEGRSYVGEVTKVSVVGTTSMGITSYPATIRIDDTDGLLPGMNVDAEIVLSQAADVLTIPSAAVSRGGLVLVTSDSPSAVNAVEDSRQTPPEGYVYVRVTTGESDDDYIEVRDGLREGDTVGYTAAANTQQAFMMGGMPGMGMPGGGMPGGGGMPAGGPGGSGSRPSGGFSRGGN